MPTDVLSRPQVSSPPGPAAPVRLDYIDGLRGLAMLAVVLCHCWFSGRWHVYVPWGRDRYDIALWSVYGMNGVDLFLVLSGFCLFWPLAQGRREPTLWQFFQRRCRRILPPYYVAMLLFGGLALFWPHGAYSHAYVARWFVWHALMVHNLSPEYVQQIAGPFWSLGLEFQLYVMFPLLVEAFRRFGPLPVVVCSVLACAVFRYLLLRWQVPVDGVYLFVTPACLFARFSEFVIGMYTARLVSDWHRSGQSPIRPADYLVAALVLCAAAGPSVLAWLHLWHRFMASDYIVRPFFTAGCGVVFSAVILAGSRAGTGLHRLLSARWLVFLGTISYSVYLVHEPLIRHIQDKVNGHPFSNAHEIAFQAFLVVPVVLGLGYGFHLLFERPFMPGRPRTERQAERAAIAFPAP